MTLKELLPDRKITLDVYFIFIQIVCLCAFVCDVHMYILMVGLKILLQNLKKKNLLPINFWEIQ